MKKITVRSNSYKKEVITLKAYFNFVESQSNNKKIKISSLSTNYFDKTYYSMKQKKQNLIRFNETNVKSSFKTSSINNWINIKDIIEIYEKIEYATSGYSCHYYTAFLYYDNKDDFVVNDVSKVIVFQFNSKEYIDKDVIYRDLLRANDSLNFNNAKFESINIDKVITTLNDNDFDGRFSFFIGGPKASFTTSIDIPEYKLFYENNYDILKFNLNEEYCKKDSKENFKEEFRKDLKNVETISKMNKRHASDIMDYFDYYTKLIIDRKNINNFIKVYENFDREELIDIRNDPSFIKIKDSLNDIILNLLFGKKIDTAITVLGTKFLVSNNNNRRIPTFKINFLGSNFESNMIVKKISILFTTEHISILSYLYSMGKLEDLLYKFERYELSL